MNEMLFPSDDLFVANDRFIVDNMLTEEDLDLDPYLWNDLSSNESNSCDLTHISEVLMADTLGSGMTVMEAPETPPSSDRSTPPNFDDLSHKLQKTCRRHDNVVPIQLKDSTVPNITLIPAITPFCPISPLSPLSPILANQTPILTIKTQNELNSMNANINCNTITKSGVNSDDKRMNLSALRREARKLRNREAASISRKRKKEYIEGLEEKVKGLLRENKELKNDNQKLRQKILDFEEKHKMFTKRGINYSSVETNCNCRTVLSTNSNKKTTISLLAVILMLGLNLAPFSGISITNDNSISQLDSNPRLDSVKHGTSRSLLWNANDNNMDVIAFNTSAIRNSSRLDRNCKTYINQTESLRLETDLRDWLSRVKLEKEEVFKQRTRLKANSNKLKDRYNKAIPLPRLKAWIQKRTETDFNANEFNDYSIDSYKNALKIPKINYEDLLSAIHRRDDTFYLLSYSSKDHLIIPPISTNSSDIRPRFSLLMPLISTLNESSIRGTNVSYNQMSIMQIDCQVINTKIVLFNTYSPNSRTQTHSSEDSNTQSVRNSTTRRMTNNKTLIASKNLTQKSVQ